jgi:hypothetical protein
MRRSVEQSQDQSQPQQMLGLNLATVAGLEEPLQAFDRGVVLLDDVIEIAATTHDDGVPFGIFVA